MNFAEVSMRRKSGRYSSVYVNLDQVLWVEQSGDETSLVFVDRIIKIGKHVDDFLDEVRELGAKVHAWRGGA